ncbi:MAG: Alanine-tRNA ligase, partial [Candidatus Roizmanbacteria bacterium GW2011_GWA2_37_7]
MPLTHRELRALFASFMKKHGHVEVPPISLVPQNDPTTLFTGSGMQQFVPYLLGQQHPQGTRLFNIQPCFRSQDIEEVGDNRHDTLFEMMGNWSFGDYFKKEQLKNFFMFLTDKHEGLGLQANKLYATVFEGNDQAPQDTES